MFTGFNPRFRIAGEGPLGTLREESETDNGVGAGVGVGDNVPPDVLNAIRKAGISKLNLQVVTASVEDVAEAQATSD